MIGERFGNYRATALLGEGGMGAVYLAEHPEIGRRVAVKVLHPSYSRDQHLLVRFLNEARAANAIRHPNIIEVLDSGTLADGTPFLVMELLEGESLAARIRKRGRLPIGMAVDFARQTASALASAHKKGIIHRDLKPDNLFIVADPQHERRERIKVLDFGIAKLQQSFSSEPTRTRTGALMGTPTYMSPEQCRGTRSVDHRTDLYSLGVILYEMLTGHPPFVSEGFGELVSMHLNATVPSARTTRPDLPVSLDQVVTKLLEKSPDARFASMDELRAALGAAAGSEIGQPGSSPDFGRTRASAGRDTTLSGNAGERAPASRAGGGRGKWAAALVAALALGGGYLFVGRGRHGASTTSSPGVPSPGPRAATAARSGMGPPVPSSPAAAPRQVTVRVTSVPAGARVSSGPQGPVLGLTPLVFTHSPGGTMGLHIEKDGYVALERTVPLEADLDLEVTLDPRPRLRPAKPRRRSPESDGISEPAKL